MEGVWKSLVQPVKTGLKEIIKNRIFTDKEFETILREIQSLLTH